MPYARLLCEGLSGEGARPVKTQHLFIGIAAYKDPVPLPYLSQICCAQHAPEDTMFYQFVLPLVNLVEGESCRLHISSLYKTCFSLKTLLLVNMHLISASYTMFQILLLIIQSCLVIKYFHEIISVLSLTRCVIQSKSSTDNYMFIPTL